MVAGAAGFVLCVLILHVAEGFASADATKGLSDRTLETFGLHTPMLLELYRKFLFWWTFIF